MAVRHRVVQESARNQSRRVADVREQKSTHLVRDAAELGVVDVAAVGAGSANNHFGLLAVGDFANIGVVQLAGLALEAVERGAVGLAAEVHGGTVRQVAAVAEVKPENSVARLEAREVDGSIGLRSAVRLNVDVFGIKKFAGAVACEVLNQVDNLASAVVALARVALGVLVGEHRSDGLHDGRRSEIFRCN